MPTCVCVCVCIRAIYPQRWIVGTEFPVESVIVFRISSSGQHQFFLCCSSSLAFCQRSNSPLWNHHLGIKFFLTKTQNKRTKIDHIPFLCLFFLLQVFPSTLRRCPFPFFVLTRYLFSSLTHLAEQKLFIEIVCRPSFSNPSLTACGGRTFYSLQFQIQFTDT